MKTSSISYLIIPQKLEDYDLENYMKDLFSKQVADNLPIGLITFDNNDPSNVFLIHNVGNLSVKKFNPISKSGRFWAKHIDLPIPLFHLILHCYYLKKIGQVKGDAFAYCWENHLFKSRSLETLEPTNVLDIRGEVIKTLSGRKNLAYLEKNMNKIKILSVEERERAKSKLKKDVDTSVIGDNTFNSVKKNLLTFLKHVGMVDSTGNLTDYGFKYYHLGWMHGPNSRIFQDYFLKCVLITGRHLDLIFDIDRLCNKYRDEKNMKEIRKTMENEYDEKGMIKKNPNRNAGKPSRVGFLKYEFILWRSLSLIELTKGKPDISFNWKKITEVCSLPEL